jgi:hypothetical protein
LYDIYIFPFVALCGFVLVLYFLVALKDMIVFDRYFCEYCMLGLVFGHDNFHWLFAVVYGAKISVVSRREFMSTRQAARDEIFSFGVINALR